MILPFAGLLAGCRGEVLQLAPDAGSSTSTSTSELAFTGKWTGYIESYVLPSGSSTLTMDFVQQPDGTITGTVTFGDAPAPPPATDPNVGYPPGSGATPLTPASIEGFPYTARQISFDGPRVRLGISTLELWKGWCALQTSVPLMLQNGLGTMYGCTPVGYATDSSGVCYGSGGSQPIDCGSAALCTAITCDCTATSCTVDRSTSDITFDMQLTGTRLDGTIATQPYVGTQSDSSTPPIDRRTVHLIAGP
jgi:hypothetical protein